MRSLWIVLKHSIFQFSWASLNGMRLSIAHVVLAVTATAAIAGCSDGGGGDPPEGPSTPAVTPETQYPPVPTPEELNRELARGFDPAVPLEEKSAFVQGAEEDPAIIDQVVQAALASDATVEIVSVDDLGDGTLSAGATLSIGGQPNQASIIFVAEDAVWKLSRDNACGIVGIAGLTSSACPG